MQTSTPLYARQPIFDAGLNVVAHELLFRGASATAETATADVLLAALDQSLFEEQASNLPVFVNFPARVLLQMPRLNKSKLVVEVLEDVAVTPDLLQSVKSLHAEGYQIALDDYVHTENMAQLLPFANIVKLDVLETRGQALAELAGELRQPGRQLLAEKVEDHQVYTQCQTLGMDLYQGYFFAKPNVVPGTAVSASAVTVLELLSALQDPDMTPERLEAIILGDAVLTYRMIKLVNSASYRRANEIDSVAAAIVMLGMQQVTAFASLLSLSSNTEKPRALDAYTAMRADFCQRLGQQASIALPSESLFALGVLSCIGAYFDQPMEALVGSLHVTDDFKTALVHGEGMLGALLDLAQNYQEGAWHKVDWASLQGLDITPAQADAAFRESQDWLATHQTDLLGG